MLELEYVAYIAGFTDGEGSVKLEKKYSSSPYRRPVVSISNNERSILEWIQSHFGGVICEKKPAKPEHNTNYEIAWEHNAALYVLEKIIPYMKHPKKKARAQYLLDNYKRVTLRNGRYNEEEMVRKLDFERGFFAIAG
jgi:hypothetical protein